MKKTVPHDHWRTVIACTALLWLGACASGKPPVETMTLARAALSQAERAGAATGAPVEFLAARDKLGKAEAAVKDERYEQARQLAEDAEATAALAEYKARAERSRLAAAELKRSNETLRQELERRAKP